MNPKGVVLTALACLALFCAGCATAPTGVKPGTPAFYWATANTAYAAGDYVKTSENLAQLVNTDNEFTARARIWQVMLNAGLAKGYVETADAYENGARYNRTDVAGFRRRITELRTRASQNAMSSTEALHRAMDASKEATIPVAFAFPAAVPPETPGLAKLKKGLLLQGSEAADLETAMVRRNMQLVAARLAGQPKDSAKAAEVFGSGSVPRQAFLTGAATTFSDLMDLFGNKKLDDPKRMKVMATEALEALAGVPPTKETKALEKKLQKAAKPS